MRILNAPFTSVVADSSARGFSRRASTFWLGNLASASVKPKWGRTETTNVRFESTPTQNGRRRVSRFECQRRISTPLATFLRDRIEGSSGVEWTDVEDGDEGRLGVRVEAVPKEISCCEWRKARFSNSGVISSGLGGSSIPPSRFSVDSDKAWLPLGRSSSESYGSAGSFGKYANPD